MTTTQGPASGGGARVTGVSFSDATSASSLSLLPLQSRNGGNSSPTIMEGVLKKRGANLPVMRDRYCVATWEAERKFVLLRTYKNQKSFAKSPEKPVSAHALKCFGAWDGKGNFHRYDHAFLMETTESKVFFCTAPTEAEKRRWIDVMKTAASAVQHSSSKSDVGDSDSENGGEEEEEEGASRLHRGASNGVRPSIANRQSSRAVRKGESSRSYAFEAESDDDDEEIDRENGMHSVTDSEQSPDDGLFRSSSGADSVLSGSDLSGASKAEPADWGIFGESFDGPTVSKYDVVDRPVLLLDDELLNEPVDKTPLASDSFLFEDAGPSRFGAVIVNKSGDTSDDDLADFVDEGLAARLEREKSEKQLKKRVQKLESNRDLYAEMAAARLNSMRKDARHPTKKSPREFSFRPSQYVGSVSEYNESEDGYSQMTDAGYDEQMSSEAGLFAESEASSRNGVDEEQPRASKHRDQRVADDEVLGQEVDGVDEETDAAIQREIRRKKKKKEKQALESRRSETSELFEQASEVVEVAQEPLFDDHQSDRSDGEEEQEVVQVRRRKSKSKKPSHEETSVETAPTEDLLLFESPDSVVNEEGEREEEERYETERRLEKERRREERRARKERQRREEEEVAAVAAAELARQHRDAMREREDEKARKREKKERRERRERAKMEKEKKLRKSKEAELQAEVERLRLAQLQQQAEDEKKERKKKRRDKEKYSTPAERIQRKEREAEAHAAEMSSALVLVETPAPAVAQASAPTPVQTASPAQDSEHAPVSPPTRAPAPTPALDAPAVIKIIEPTQPPYSAPAPVAASPVYQEPAQAVFDQQPQTAPVPAAPQSQPAYPMMPQYIPGYPTPPQSMSMYTSPSPYGMYQPQYLPQPYYPPQYANMAYGSIQPQYYQPPVGYMSGAPMMSQPYPGAVAYPEMPSSASGAPHTSAADDEPVFIGPKLPSPKAQAPAGPSVSIGPPPPPVSSSHAPRSTSPALPDLPDLPDIADF
ncbi:hypothetical protein Gpo141_00011633 [Globisporangium polare]